MVQSKKEDTAFLGSVSSGGEKMRRCTNAVLTSAARLDRGNSGKLIKLHVAVGS
jgi:hypothetical protein